MTKRMRSQECDQLVNTDQSMGRASIILEPDTFERFMESGANACRYSRQGARN